MAVVEAGHVTIVEIRTRDKRGLVRREIWRTREVRELVPGDLVEDPVNEAGERVEVSAPYRSWWTFKMTGSATAEVSPARVYWSLKEEDVQHGSWLDDEGPDDFETKRMIRAALQNQQLGWSDKDELSLRLMVPVARVARLLRELRKEGLVEVNVVRGGYRWHRTEDCSEFCRHAKRRTT